MEQPNGQRRVADGSATQEADPTLVERGPEPDAPERQHVAELTATPGAEQHARPEEVSETAQWDRWKGSLTDIAAVIRTTLDLFREATSDEELSFNTNPIHVTAVGRERYFASVDDFVAAADELDLSTLQVIYVSAYSQRVNVTVMIGNIGTYFSVRGEDNFAVAGIAKELKAVLNKGRRWTQIRVLQPSFLQSIAPWPAIAGASLAILTDGSAAETISTVLVFTTVALVAALLVMRFLEPKLVPPLEILSGAQAQSRAQAWTGRAVKVLALVGVAVLGAVINEATGLLF